ncbi:MAG TPA: DUF2254 domain-containing protein [Anaerolineae bacterium]|nr:DUF2254 domain-containing protein [Anaerolineae bacterium]
MRTKLVFYWAKLSGSYWFIPSLMLISAVVLAAVMINLDTLPQGEWQDVWWIYTGGPDGARTLLSTVAGSMISAATLAFSITMVVLTLASSQFGPRLLNNFLRDRGNQIVLGTFIATFMYCLLILRTVRGEDHAIFVPHLSVTVAVVLTIANLGVLVYFIHHVSTSIRAESIIARIGDDLDNAIDRLRPDGDSVQPWERRLREGDDIPADFEAEAFTLASERSGYVQAIDADSLMKIAKEHNLVLQVQGRKGHFIGRGADLVKIWSEEALSDELKNQINQGFIVDIHRLQRQDIEFAIDQLVEIAARALSPGVNDPFTAMACVDQLGVALARLAEKQVPPAYRYDDAGQLRLIFQPLTFTTLTNRAFDQIRQYARTNTAVTIRLLETIAVIVAQANDEEERQVLLNQAKMINQGGQEALPERSDRNEVHRSYQMIQTLVMSY